MDKFEKYLLENRDELDRMEPLDEDKMWQGIEGKVSSPQSTVHRLQPRFKWKWMAMAASVAALVGWGLLMLQPPEINEQIIIRISPDDFPPELAERGAALQHTISQKEIELGLAELDRTIYAEVFGELAELEESAELARKDFAEGQVNERALETLLRQYELKIRILENLSREIENQKYHEELEKEI